MWKVLLLAVGYFSAAWLGLKLAPPELAISLIWLPTGIAVAALYRCGLRCWPAIPLAAVILQEYSFSMPWPYAGIVVLGQTLGPVVTVLLLRKTGFDPQLLHRRDIGFFCASAAVGMAISATGGTCGLLSGGIISSEAFWTSWTSWWLGDLMGVLTASPVLLCLHLPSAKKMWKERNREFVLWLASAVTVMSVVFFLPGLAGFRYLPLIFLPLFFTIWAAMRLGTAGAGLGIFLLALLAASGTAWGRGPFLQPGIYEGVFVLWAYLGSSVIMMLMITAIEIGRRAAEDDLMASNQELALALDRERALKAKADSASRAKSDFLAKMSHEIRNPLSGVLGMAGLLSESNLPAEEKEYVDLIKKSGDSMLELLNDILDFSKIEAGLLILREEEFSLTEVLEESAGLLRILAKQKNLEFFLEISPTCGGTFRGDPGRLKQILLNLGGNAVKFSTGPDVRLTVGASVQELEFLIFDSGPGIPEDQLPLLFQPFSQLPASGANRGGTGLGLAISKQLVELFGGSIGVRCNPEGGSVFWFRIPLQKI